MFDQTPDLTRFDKNAVKDFVWCELEKKDIDHFKAIKDLAFSLQISAGDIGYAGIKDKRPGQVKEYLYLNLI
jgi:tRNA(Glu) U13 pseudouridine synthase TruD